MRLTAFRAMFRGPEGSVGANGRSASVSFPDGYGGSYSLSVFHDLGTSFYVYSDAAGTGGHILDVSAKAGAASVLDGVRPWKRGSAG